MNDPEKRGSITDSTVISVTPRLTSDVALSLLTLLILLFLSCLRDNPAAHDSTAFREASELARHLAEGLASRQIENESCPAVSDTGIVSCDTRTRRS